MAEKDIGKEKFRILIVDDNDEVRAVLKDSLSQLYEVFVASSGAEAVQKLNSVRPDMILVDIEMPQMSGIEVCEAVRKNPITSNVPILVISGVFSEDVRTLAYATGADDYLQKPFSDRELKARVAAKLRWRMTSKNAEAGQGMIEFGNTAIDLDRRIVRVDGNSVELTYFEYDLLNMLANRIDSVVTRSEISEKFWPGTQVVPRALDVHIFALRNKLDESTFEIATVRKAGFILRERKV